MRARQSCAQPLVRVNDEIDGITIYGGEADEKQILNRVFDTVLEISTAYRRCSHPADLGYGRLWLVHARCAHPGGGAQLSVGAT